MLSVKQAVMPGLYAAGEVAGFGGINGRAALEGTFLGPCIVTGRVAARTALREIGKHSAPFAASSHKDLPPANEPCTTCHDIAGEVAAKRPGYWHFDRVHTTVLSRDDKCTTCHRAHEIDLLAQAGTCVRCHGAKE